MQKEQEGKIVCGICHRFFGHDVQCPFAGAAKDIKRCACCEEEIENGMDFYTVPGGMYLCESCVQRMDKEEILDFFGAERSIE